MEWHLIILVLIMVFCGLLGGLVSYFLNYKYSDNRDIPIIKPLVIGIAAAFLVPLFLNLISSDLMNESRGDNYKLLVFAGFCLVASISSKAFIQNISDKLFKVEKQVNDFKKEIEPIIQNQTEDEQGEVSLVGLLTSSRASGESNNSKIKILIALKQGRYTFRSLEGISQTVEMGKDEVETILDVLSRAGLVEQIFHESGKRFFITKSGRNYIKSYTSPSHSVEDSNEEKVS